MPPMRTGRRGRPSAAEVDRRRRAVLAATAELLVAHGPRGTTTAAVAEAAGVSKESLYSWFGDKDGLFAAMVEANAARMNAQVERALAAQEQVRATLETFATDLLRLLTGPGSVAVNRAAAAELPGAPAMARALLRHGRHATGPLVETYLADAMDRGALPRADPAETFTLLYGLVVRDTQIRCLLGEPAPPEPALARQARDGVEHLLTLLAAGVVPGRGTDPQVLG